MAPLRLSACLAGGFLLLSGSVVHADIYKSVGEDGVVSFTNTPKKGAERVARESPRTSRAVMPKDRSPDRIHRYDAYIREAAALYQIPESLIRAVIKVESDFDPRALSPANAHGLMQLIPQTAERMMVQDIYDPRQNVFGGTRYLRILANLFNGDLQLTVAAYNSGENAVIRHGGIPPYAETQRYVVKVLEYYRHYRDLETLASATGR